MKAWQIPRYKGAVFPLIRSDNLDLCNTHVQEMYLFPACSASRIQLMFRSGMNHERRQRKEYLHTLSYSYCRAKLMRINAERTTIMACPTVLQMRRILSQEKLQRRNSNFISEIKKFSGGLLMSLVGCTANSIKKVSQTQITFSWMFRRLFVRCWPQ